MDGNSPLCSPIYISFFLSELGAFHSLFRPTIYTVAGIGHILVIPHRKYEGIEGHIYPFNENPDRKDHRRVHVVSRSRARTSTAGFAARTEVLTPQ